MYTIEEKVQSWATILLAASGAALLTVTAMFIANQAAGVKILNGAKVVNMMADSHRMASLAKTYDAKAAAESMKVLVDGLSTP